MQWGCGDDRKEEINMSSDDRGERSSLAGLR